MGHDSFIFEHPIETSRDLEESLALLRRQSDEGSGSAALWLALLHDPSNHVVPEHLLATVPVSVEAANALYIKAFSLLLEEANSGAGESMRLLASYYYQVGTPPVTRDEAECIRWNEKAYDAGIVMAADYLYPAYSNPKSAFYSPEKAQQLLIDLERRGYRWMSR